MRTCLLTILCLTHLLANAQSLDEVSLLEPSAKEQALLNQNGFVVTERLEFANHLHAMGYLWAKDKPFYLSADAMLYAVQYGYGKHMKTLEREVFQPKIIYLLERLHSQLPIAEQRYAYRENIEQNLRDIDLYLAVAINLAKVDYNDVDNPNFELKHSAYYPENKVEVLKLLQIICKGTGIVKYPLFSSKDRNIDCSVFAYSEYFDKSYWRLLRWLQTARFYLQVSPAMDLDATDVKRHTRNMSLLFTLLQDDKLVPWYREINDAFGLLIGQENGLGFDRTLRLMEQYPPDILWTNEGYAAFKKTLAEDNTLHVKVRQGLIDATQEQGPMVYFGLLDVRICADAGILQRVTFGELTRNGQPVPRLLPQMADVLYALGNDHALMVLQPELEKYQYKEALNEARQMVEERIADNTLYNHWLSAIMAQNPPANKTALPTFMQKPAWWDAKMSSQLAQWTDLAYLNALYTPYSMSGMGGCSFPHVYIEPVPELYGALHRYAQQGLQLCDRMVDADGKTISKFRAHFALLDSVCPILQGIAKKELTGQTLDSSEVAFLKMAVSAKPRSAFYMEMAVDFSGWYSRLVNSEWQYDNNHNRHKVHYAPTDEMGNPFGGYLCAKRGATQLLMARMEVEGKPILFYGTISSFQEGIKYDNRTQTDDLGMEETQKLARPAFTNSYVAQDSTKHIDLARRMLCDKELLEELEKNEKGKGALFRSANNTFVPFVVEGVSPNPFRTKISLRIHGYDIEVGQISRCHTIITDLEGREIARPSLLANGDDEWEADWDGLVNFSTPAAKGYYFWTFYYDNKPVRTIKIWKQ